MNIFLDQLATEEEKFANDCEWFKNWITAAETSSYRRLERVLKIDRNMNRFAGNVMDDYKNLNQTAGRANIHQVKNTNFASAKMFLLLGEMLEKPLNGTVYSVNPTAKIEKFERQAQMAGLYHTQEERKKVHELTGMDMYPGMPTPTEDPLLPKNSMRSRLQHENIMQLVLNGLMEKGDVKSKLFRDYKHLLIGDECFGQVCYNENTKMPYYRSIDIRNALYQEMDDDPFLLRTPFIGAGSWMTFSEILDSFDLTHDQIQELKNIRDTGSTSLMNYNTPRHNFYEYDDNRGLLFWVTNIEIKAETPLYYKVSQDNYGNTHTKPFYDALSFESEWDIHKRKTEAGKYSIGRKYKSCIYTATRIGHTVYCNMEKKKFAIGSFESPADAMFSYTGLIFNRTAGSSTSLFGMLEQLSMLHDVAIQKITNEIIKADGAVVTFDEAYLPKGKTVKGVKYDARNHGFVTVNSAADGNESGADMTQTQKLGMNIIDHSASQLVNQCLSLIISIDQMADRLTGINENREGMPKASMTATAGTNAIGASRSITYARTYFFDKFTENVMGRLIEYGKIAIGYDPNFFINLIGVEGIAYIKSLGNIPLNTYWTYLHDPSKERYIRETMRNYFGQAINAGEMRPVDAMKFEMSETMSEAIGILEEGWQKVKEIEERQQQAAAQQQESSEERQERVMKEMQDDKQLGQWITEMIKGKYKNGADDKNLLTELVMQEREIQKEQLIQKAAPQ